MQRTNSRLLAASIGMLALLGVVLAACAPAPPPPPPPTTVTSPPPTGPAPTGFGEIQADCPFDHRRADDPIVHAGMPGMAHSHDFFGATTTDASSTAASLHAGSTTCDPALDHSAYWFPTLSDGGAALTPDRATFYYTAETTDPRLVQTIPDGLMMIAGDATRSGPTGTSRYTWSCQGSGVSSTALPPLCPAGSSLELLLHFPDCWDGVHLDSADHRSHVAYSNAKQCPADHPVPIAALEFKLRWPTRGGAGITLSSGNGYSAHGDFINAWDPAGLAARVSNCLRAGRKCGTDGVPLP